MTLGVTFVSQRAKSRTCEHQKRFKCIMVNMIVIRLDSSVGIFLQTMSNHTFYCRSLLEYNQKRLLL